MQFFKHYHNADSSTFIQKLINNYGLTAYAQWFLMLELLCEKFDGETTLIELTRSEVALKLRIKSGRVDVVLGWFSELLENQNSSTDFILKIDAPILLELQDRDFKFARKKRVSSDAKNKIKNKIKDKEKEEDIKAPPSVSISENPKVEIVPTIENLDEKIPADIYAYLTVSLMYPEDVVEAVRKEARLQFISSVDPGKDWHRFIGKYFKYEKHRIEAALQERAKNLPKPQKNHADCNLCDNSGRAIMIEKKSGADYAFQCTCTRGPEQNGLPRQWEGMSETYTHFKSWSVGNFDRKDVVKNHRASVAI